MATTTPRPLVEGVFMAAAAATVFTVADNTKTRIIAGTVNNTDAGARTYSIYLVPSGATRGPEHLVAKDVSLAAGETKTVQGALGHVLSAGDTIDVVSDAADKVALRLSGYDFVG